MRESDGMGVCCTGSKRVDCESPLRLRQHGWNAFSSTKSEHEQSTRLKATIYMSDSSTVTLVWLPKTTAINAPDISHSTVVSNNAHRTHHRKAQKKTLARPQLSARTGCRCGLRLLVGYCSIYGCASFNCFFFRRYGYHLKAGEYRSTVIWLNSACCDDC
jgi:hypothetical protein